MMTANRKTTILEQRQARGWSRARLAREAGITEQTIVRAEKGLVRTSLESITAIAAALAIPADSLVHEPAHVSTVPAHSCGTPDATSEKTPAPDARQASSTSGADREEA